MTTFTKDVIMNKKIILDALDLYRQWMENDDHAPPLESFPYSLADVDNVIQSIKNQE